MHIMSCVLMMKNVGLGSESITESLKGGIIVEPMKLVNGHNKRVMPLLTGCLFQTCHPFRKIQKMNEPYDLNGKAYKDLPNRLERQAKNVEQDGWLNAARLMRNAADVLRELHDNGVIKLDLH